VNATVTVCSDKCRQVRLKVPTQEYYSQNKSKMLNQLVKHSLTNVNNLPRLTELKETKYRD